MGSFPLQGRQAGGRQSQGPPSLFSRALRTGLATVFGCSSRPGMEAFPPERLCAAVWSLLPVQETRSFPAQALLHSFSCSAQHTGNFAGNLQGYGSRRLAWLTPTLRGSLWGSAPYAKSLLLYPYRGGPGPLFLPSSQGKPLKPRPLPRTQWPSVSLRAPGFQPEFCTICVLFHVFTNMVCH